jgi:hypothetical protein
MPDAGIVLLVMRLADMERVHPDQDNSRVCGQCGERVGIYPSGQEVLRRVPTATIVCERCNQPAPAEVMILAPGAEHERAESHPAPKPPPRDRH